MSVVDFFTKEEVDAEQDEEWIVFVRKGGFIEYRGSPNVTPALLMYANIVCTKIAENAYGFNNRGKKDE